MLKVFMSQLKNWWSQWWLAALIVLLALVLRGWQLGQVPHGLTWDEAAIGYNGFGIITNRRDEWLFKLPISFRSFGDYKAPLAIYLNGIFTTLLHLGLTPWAIRLPFMLSGVVGVVGLLLLTNDVLVWVGLKSSALRKVLSLSAAAWLTISPWHIHFTRTGFESGLTVTLIIWASWFWFKAMQAGKWQWWVLSALTWVASLYTYHSAKIMVPCLLLVAAISCWRSLQKWWRPVLAAAGVASLSLLPLLKDMFFGSGLTRASSLVFGHVHSVGELGAALLHNVVVHFSLGFWVMGATTTLRHSDGHFGIVYWLDLLPLALVLVGFIGRRWRHLAFTWWDRWVIAGLVWSFLGLLPAILGDEVPHPNRALLAIVGVSWIVLAGWQWGFSELQAKVTVKSQSFLKWTLISVIAAYTLCLVAYQWSYYTIFAKASAEAFLDGYMEAANFAVAHEKDPQQQPPIEKILFTNHYGEPYIYVLLARRTTPYFYQNGALIKYEFTNKITVGDLDRPNTLIVAGEADSIPIEKADQLIRGSDGQVRFKLYLPKAQP